MNYSIIIYILGHIFNFSAVFMILPCITAVIYQEPAGLWFLVCGLVLAFVGVLLSKKKPENKKIYAKEGMVIVALSWLFISLIGALPYMLTGSIPSFTNALFESVSGFSTTGASILNDVESLPCSVLFWRCFTNWIGGMGVLVFIMALLPYLGASNMYLMRAESTGPSVGKLVPKVQKTAAWLYAMYMGLTILQIILLLFGGMPVFDAVCDSLATAGTGGFAVKSDSITGYNTYIQVVITIFMFLFGINFKFYFLLIGKKFKDAFKMEEVRWYFIIYIAAVALITLDITKDIGNLAVNLKDAAFQVSTIITTTGFATADYCTWPLFSQTLLLMLMFLGACAGSTSGGIKVSRFILYIKMMKKELAFQLHPHSIKKIKMDERTVEHEILRSANGFLLVYLLIGIVSLILVSLDNFDFATSFSAVAACLNDIGPGLGMVGPTGNYAEFSILSKYVLMFDMLAGRLEMIPMMLLLTPATWRRQ